MAWGIYLNMEYLSIKVANEHIDKMTNNNYTNYSFVDENAFCNNLENGFICLTLLNCYFESLLNTILNSCMNCESEKLLKLSIDEKIDLIFLYYKKDFSDIKSRNEWNIYRQFTRIRNELIHFKKSFIGDGTDIPPITFGNTNLIDYFTQENIIKCKENVINLSKLIAERLELCIYEEIGTFASDGRDGLVNYIYDPKTTPIDPSRFNN